ncbi:cupin domain-containing protein [Xanthobacter agilis]|uniref:Quercetin dioxygenase-like cupin family protein n=1 Tax=Xanthobacter agilis TaxID=47492 RepID=A0ABU0LHX9_XANAG|nr:cupin domain-containing protein [Xanthobacter agilis]MDQ0506734.1 quercetin dioxygenase-like cupin family protein [Xanthobacter agilis]
MATRRYLVRESEVETYSPANHSGTVNRRLISRETVGAEQVEVLLGTIEKGAGAHPHHHDGIEQVCYVLAGEATAEVDGQTLHLGPGDVCFFPAGKDHVFTAASEAPVRVLVIYAPPYAEKV